jgi:hypothetical protein
MRVLLAALFYLPSSTYLLLPGNAAFALRPSALRKVSGDAIMTTPGGARATTYSYNPPVLGAPASIMGRSFLSLLCSGPSLCPTPKLQGASYVQITVVYIRNIIPVGGLLPRRRSRPSGPGLCLTSP